MVSEKHPHFLQIICHDHPNANKNNTENQVILVVVSQGCLDTNTHSYCRICVVGFVIQGNHDEEEDVLATNVSSSSSSSVGNAVLVLSLVVDSGSLPVQLTLEDNVVLEVTEGNFCFCGSLP
mmetsp:Transcript_18217/g.37673  ORF Transcript_18217/g.37673 Transcript_18217/m.37673 type:complete len:122 (-) Transcript_18217:1077-1442(-)